MNAEEIMKCIDTSQLDETELRICRTIVDAYAVITTEEIHNKVRRDISKALAQLGNPVLGPMEITPFVQRRRTLVGLANSVFCVCEQQIRIELKLPPLGVSP